MGVPRDEWPQSMLPLTREVGVDSQRGEGRTPATPTQKMIATLLALGIPGLGVMQFQSSLDMFTWKDAERMESNLIRSVGALEILLRTQGEQIDSFHSIIDKIHREQAQTAERCRSLDGQIKSLEEDVQALESRMELRPWIPGGRR